MDTYAEREGWRQAYPAPISSGGSDRLVRDDWARAPETRSSSHSERGPTQSTSRPQLPSQQTARSPSPPFQSRPASVSTPSYAHSPFPSSTPAPAPSDATFYAKRAGQPLTFGSLEQSAGVARSLMPGKNEAALGYDSLLGPHPTSSSSSSGAPDGFQYGRPSAREQDRGRAVTPQSGGSESGHSVRSRSSNTDRWRREGMYGQGAEGLPDLPYQRQPPFEQHTSSTSTTTIQPAGSYFPADNPTGEERDRSSSRLRFPAAASTTTPTASSLLLSPLSPLVAPFSPASGSSSNGSLNWGPAAKGPSNVSTPTYECVSDGLQGLSSERGLPTSPLDLRSYPLHAQQQQQQQQQLLYEQQEQQRDRDEEDQYRQQQHFEQMERREFDDHQQTPNAQRTQYSALPPMGKYPNIASLGLTDHGAALPHPSDVAASHAYHHHQQQFAYEYGDVPSSSWSATMSANGSREGLRREYRATNGSSLGEMAAARSAGMMGPGANNSGGGSQAGGGSSVEGAEEISTIFVVGFPDDMLEREFQNMFVFSVGFEAATLKIPAGSGLKDSKGGSDRPSTATGSHGDPYAGMLGQDGSAAYDDAFANQPLDSASNPATLVHVHALAIAATRSTAGSPSSRKQIIGFAKFRTRAQALDARDVLSGRKVDAEKGSMLKAEMAKKNLHTKRGISNELAGGVSMNSLDPATLGRLANTSTLNPAVLAELARQNAIAQHISATPTPQTMSNGLQSTAAFDAFHSVPQQHSAPPPRRDRELSGASTANFPLSGALSTRSARDRHSAQSEPYHDEPHTSPVPASAAYYSLPRQQSEMASPPLQQQRAFPGPPHPQQLKERGMSAEEYAEEMGETSPRMRNSMLQGQGGWSGKSMMQQLDEGTELAMDMEREREARSQQHLYLQQQAHFQNHPPPPLPQNYGERPQHDPYRQAQQFPPPSLHYPPNEHSYLADDRYHQSLFVQQQAMARPGPSSLPMGPAISANSIPRTQNPGEHSRLPETTLTPRSGHERAKEHALRRWTTGGAPLAHRTVQRRTS